MAKFVKTSNEEPSYDWFQISGILRLGVLDREVVKIKYPDQTYTEGEWVEILKKDGLNF